MTEAVDIPAPYDRVPLPRLNELILPVVWVTGPQAVAAARALTTGIFQVVAVAGSGDETVDLCMLAKFDAVIRVPGDDPRADRAVRLAFEMEIPVFHDIDDLAAWAERWV